MKELIFDPALHMYTLDGLPVPSVTRIIAPLYDFSKIPQAVLARAAARGTAVHVATEDHDRDPFGDDPDIKLSDIAPLEIRSSSDAWHPEGETGPYMIAWRRFLAETGFEIHAIEERTFSIRHRYAGTIDRLGSLNGRRCVLDIKTTSFLAPQVGIQLAAYQQAANEHRPKAERYVHRFACQLRRDGTYRLEEYKDASDFSTFLALLQIHNWALRHGGR